VGAPPRAEGGACEELPPAFALGDEPESDADFWPLLEDEAPPLVFSLV
jgi:hypothetical protein